jgi:tetratricopeptide (TPR) repeat protein
VNRVLGKGGGLSLAEWQRKMSKSMTVQNTSPDPKEQGALDCSDPAHTQLTEQEEQVHRLIHQGIDATEHGDLASAQAIFAQALQLSRTHTLPQWEAQALFSHGVTLDRAGQYTEAIPWFEQALALFQTHGPIRMILTVSIFLANMLTKTGDPECALPILQQAKQQADRGLEAGELQEIEHEYEVYGLLREQGRAYLEVGQIQKAVEMYQQALTLDPLYAGAKETAALYQDIILLHWQQGSLSDALSFGAQVIDVLDPSSARDLEILADVTFQLGLLCSQTHHSRMAVHYGQVAFQYMQRLRVKKPELSSSPQTVAFLGRTCVNIGSGYGGTANCLSDYGTILAYWRTGEELLSRVGAEDVMVPRDNIAGLKRIAQQQMGAGAYALVEQESLPLYQEIQAALAEPALAPGPRLTALMEAATSVSLRTSRPANRSRTKTRKKRDQS